jgi:arginyl-tRNA synthetase
MPLLFDNVRKSVADQLTPALQQLGADATVAEVYRFLVDPPSAEVGHLAFGVFSFAKKAGVNPKQFADQLSEKLKVPGVSISAAGPYVNFTFTPGFLSEQVLRPILSAQVFSQPLSEQNQKTMVEFSQPNTHKELHVGHMRNLCLGDAIVRLLRRVHGSEQIITSTFPGDVGTHVAKCLWYIKNHIEPAIFAAKRNAADRGEWLGQMYSAGNIKLEDQAKVPELYEKNKQQLTEILRQLESKNGEYYQLWQETRPWSIELMNRTYAWANVQFDKWYWESEVDSESIKTVKGYLEKGLLQKSEGAVGLDLSAENLGFCLLLKSDGTGLYATKDIELARRKFEDFKIQKSIYVVDQRQALHFKQVFRTLQHLGFPQAKDCFHLQYNFVELPDGAMSSRKGNIVPLMTLVQNMTEHVKTQYLSRYKGEWDEAEINATATIVAQGAIKYGMVRQDTNKKIVFDMSEWLRIDGESGPFIQYSYARINSLVKKAGVELDSKNPQFDGTLLQHHAELRLMQHLLNFNSVVHLSAEAYRPSTLCTYLYEAAKKFNFFYHECSIGQAETSELKTARLVLAMATREVLREGLSYLGIPVPERM